MEEVKVVNKETNQKLWTSSFVLLTQGQLVSSLGDVIYEVALGFWILAVTGSTALMGTLMAASVLPRVIVSPFAGVIVDRSDRRKLLILMDVIRGILIVFVGVAAYLKFIEVWMVFGAGIIMGICGAFFTPAVNSSMPDIVPQSKLMQANSIYGMTLSGSNIIGNSAGGFLYQLIGAPAMFLFNGLSYLFSSFCMVFMKLPRIDSQAKKQDFFDDMKQGFRFMWDFKALRNLMIILVFINFVANMAIVLFLPLFQRSTELGPGKYGVAMALLTGGMLAGMLFTSIVKIPPHRRAAAFMFSGMISMASGAAFPLAPNFSVMLILAFIAGALNAVINMFFSSTIQQTVPQDKRGKVFSLISALAQGLTPVAMAFGGVLAEFFPIKAIIAVCMSMALVLLIPYAFMKSFRRYINFNPETQTLNDIM